MIMRRLTSFTSNWVFDFIQDWSQFFEDCNWYTFRLAWIELEDDRLLGAYEFTFVLLGLGFRVRYNHTETETVKEIKSQVDAIQSGTAQTRPWSEVKKELFPTEEK